MSYTLGLLNLPKCNLNYLLQLDQFLILDLKTAMDTDALTSSHPIVQTVSTQSEIYEMFDVISYSKGACLIRMVNFVVGDEAFKAGLTVSCLND